MSAPTRPETLQSVTGLDRLLHEPSRLLIATILYPLAEADFLYLLRETGLTKGNLSSHIAKLEQAGYVEVEKTYQGKVPLTIYRLTAAGRTAFDAYRVHLQAIAHALPAPKADQARKD
jgi:DNA-binding MarR family transcriptional regulator